MNKGIEDAKKKTEGFNAGPCYLSTDSTLKKLGIELEKYFGGCFVGNDCHKLLRKKNIDELFRDLPTVVSAKTADVGVFDFTVECCEKFKIYSRSMLIAMMFLILLNISITAKLTSSK